MLLLCVEARDLRPTTLKPEQRDRTPGLFTDLSLATRRIARQRWLLGRHKKSAACWGTRAQRAPSIEDLRRLCIQRVPEVVLSHFLEFEKLSGALLQNCFCSNL